MARKNPLLELLERLLHDPARVAADLIVEVEHRGAPGDVRRLEARELAGVRRGGLELADGTLLPPHRIRRVYRGERLVWRRTAEKAAAGPGGPTAARGKGPLARG